ncbi:MAG TPA: uroporphyrinogen decarboxylase, partial [Actinomycetota bacterium]|nr:uroporphyrinogen decarboxylase [Actinomycetota bacterium]
MTATQLDRFSTAAGGGRPDATPIWFMRQAGRVLPRYRELRERYDFQTLSSDPALTAEVTMLPLEVLPVDAAILFADLMTPLAAMGIDYSIVEGVGPVVAHPLTDADRIGRIELRPTVEAIPALFEAIKLIRKELAHGIPLIGFAGAPFTIASYLIEGRGSRDLAKTKRLMFSDDPSWQMLMEKLTNLLIDYLTEQVNSGVQAFQLFDSWVGVLSPHDYREYVLPFSRRIFAQTKQLGVPRIHFGTGNATLLADMASAGAEVMGVDWRVPLDHARQ